MALKDLANYLAKNKTIEPIKELSLSIDAQVASDIVDYLLTQINDCIQRDRSTIVLNLFEKGSVDTGLKLVVPKTKRFVNGMYTEELRILLDGIEERLLKRNKNLNINSILKDNGQLRKELNEALLKIAELERKK